MDAILDYDGDGLKNAEECMHTTDPNNRDSDEDGSSDGAEIIAGTNPLDPNSYPVSPSGSNLLPISIIIASITIAAALVVFGLLLRSRPIIAQPPPRKQTHPTPKEPFKEVPQEPAKT